MVEGETFQDMERKQPSKATHKLETREGETCQYMEKKQLSKGDSPTGDSRGGDLSGHTNKSNNQGALTVWRVQREGLVRTQKGIEQIRGTHYLEMAEGGTCQDTESM